MYNSEETNDHVGIYVGVGKVVMLHIEQYVSESIRVLLKIQFVDIINIANFLYWL